MKISVIGAAAAAFRGPVSLPHNPCAQRSPARSAGRRRHATPPPVSWLASGVPKARMRILVVRDLRPNDLFPKPPATRSVTQLAGRAVWLFCFKPAPLKGRPNRQLPGAGEIMKYILSPPLRGRATQGLRQEFREPFLVQSARPYLSAPRSRSSTKPNAG